MRAWEDGLGAPGKVPGDEGVGPAVGLGAQRIPRSRPLGEIAEEGDGVTGVHAFEDAAQGHPRGFGEMDEDDGADGAGVGGHRAG